MKTRKFHLDYETFSECDLTAAGAWRYAEHESTEILCACYAFDDGPVQVWLPDATAAPLILQMRERDPLLGEIHLGPKVPKDLADHITQGGEIRAHNANFERVVTRGRAGEKLVIPMIDIEQMVCTAAKAAAHGIPRSLGDATKALESPLKDGDGRISMLQVCKPRKPTKALPDTRWTPTNAPDKFLNTYLYCADDVRAERGVDDAIPDLSPSEQKVWELDAKINDRGWAVDLKAIDDILFVVEEYKAFLSVEMERATRDDFLGDPGVKPTQREAIAEWVRANGYPGLIDMQAETVKAIVKDPAVPVKVKRVLVIYSTYNAKAITKFQAILDSVCADGRLHGMFLYHGANTGRWSSLIVQLQNLFRPVIDDPETAVQAFAARSLDWIRTLYDGVDPIKVAASCVRSVLIAGEGKDLLFPDYSGIESRLNAWIFGEEWKLKAFREYDAGVGPNVYCAVYGRQFNVDPNTISKKDPRYMQGKVTDLAFGYEGGVNALQTMADSYGIDLDAMADLAYPTLSEEVLASSMWMWNKFGRGSELRQKTYLTCDALKQLWRQSHPGIRQGWKDLKDAAELAVQNPGKGYAIPNGKAAFRVEEYRGRSWLYMKLPSGRKLAYFKPRWIPEQRILVKTPTGEEVEQVIPGELRIWHIDTKTRQFKETSNYGGAWDNNLVQGTARDKLVGGMFRLEAAGYPCIGSVHDEPITEPLEGFGSFEEASRLLCVSESWSTGLPLAVEGHRTKRYKK